MEITCLGPVLLTQAFHYTANLKSHRREGERERQRERGRLNSNHTELRRQRQRVGTERERECKRGWGADRKVEGEPKME